MGPGISLHKTLKGLGLGSCRGHKISSGINWKGQKGRKGCPAGTAWQWRWGGSGDLQGLRAPTGAEKTVHSSCLGVEGSL